MSVLRPVLTRIFGAITGAGPVADGDTERCTCHPLRGLARGA